MYPVIIALLLVAIGVESYLLWKWQLNKEMVVSLAIWSVATVYALFVASPWGGLFTLSRLIIGVMDFIYGLF